MGLDITFFRHKEDGSKDKSREVADLDDETYLSAQEEFHKDDEVVGSFRKVNFLVDFFGYLDSCQSESCDCEFVNIDRYQIEDFIEAAKRELEAVEFHFGDDLDPFSNTTTVTPAEGKTWVDLATADHEVKTCPGFFFGDTDYNELYYRKLHSAVTSFEDILSSTKWETETIWMYCWW